MRRAILTVVTASLFACSTAAAQTGDGGGELIGKGRLAGIDFHAFLRIDGEGDDTETCLELAVRRGSFDHDSLSCTEGSPERFTTEWEPLCPSRTLTFIGLVPDHMHAVHITFAEGRALRARLFRVPNHLARHRFLYVAVLRTDRAWQSLEVTTPKGKRVTVAVNEDPLLNPACDSPGKRLRRLRVLAPLVASGPDPVGGSFELRAFRWQHPHPLLRRLRCLALIGPILNQDHNPALDCSALIEGIPVIASVSGDCGRRADRMFVFGRVAAEVARVRVHLLGGGTVDSPIQPLPPEVGIGRAHVVALGSRTPTKLEAFDATGKQQFSQDMYARRPCDPGVDGGFWQVFPG